MEIKDIKLLKKLEIDDNVKKGAELVRNAIAAIGSPLNIGKYLLSVAISREMPEALELITWMKESKMDDDLKASIKKGYESLSSKPREDVSITSLDGYKLQGHIVRAENEKRIIIAFHGWRSTWIDDFGVIADFWQNSGSTVLYVEQRAQGASEGDYLTFGVYERFDCYDWAKWAAGYFGEEIPIYLAGVSMGAATVLMASSYKYPKNVKAILADCGFTSPDSIWEHVTNEYLHVPYAHGLMGKMCMETLHFNPALHSATKALEKATLPVFFIHGEDDHFVPMEMSLLNYEACSSEKEIMLVPGADHGLSYYVDTPRYEQRMLEYFEKHDK